MSAFFILEEYDCIVNGWAGGNEAIANKNADRSSSFVATPVAISNGDMFCKGCGFLLHRTELLKLCIQVADVAMSVMSCEL
jgi:hypothetical protein